MRLAVDASVLVAEALRARGQALLARDDLDLVLAAEAWSETRHELRRRVELLTQHGHLDTAAATQLLDAAQELIASRFTIVHPNIYNEHLDEARRRVPQDIRDAHTVALAIAVDSGIWTNDRDFFGCGVPVWTTETLLLHLGVT